MFTLLFFIHGNVFSVESGMSLKMTHIKCYMFVPGILAQFDTFQLMYSYLYVLWIQ